MQSASLQVIQELLRTVSTEGLPGDHHFYITFDMSNKEIEISTALREQYPSEMTIVIQNWYQNLKVEDKAFTITLNFLNIPETMKIPFESIVSFVDPSVDFGLKFERFPNMDEETKAYEGPSDQKESKNFKKNSNGKTGEVVNIDNFRKS